MKSHGKPGISQNGSYSGTGSAGKKVNPIKGVESASNAAGASKGAHATEATDAVEVASERGSVSRENEYDEFLRRSREILDTIDDQILELVARRMSIAGEILSAKLRHGITARDKNRQEQIFVRANRLAAGFAAKGIVLDEFQIRELYELLIRMGVENWQRNSGSG